jgi:hypothetical protein
MLGPIGSDIMAIFRLLSPDEIDKYIVRDEEQEIGESIQMAANGGQMQYNDEAPHLEDQRPKKFPKDHKAKILPLNEKSTIPIQDSGRTNSDNVLTDTSAEKLANNVKGRVKNHVEDGNNDLASMGILSSSSIKKIEEERRKKENDKKDSATVFLLKERQKMRESKKRMIEQHAIKSYQTNASQEFYEESEEEMADEESHNDLKGILLNKRHF